MLSLSKLVKKYSYALAQRIFSGAYITAALEWKTTDRFPNISEYRLKPGAKPIMEDGKLIGYQEKDVDILYTVLTQATLVLKNTSAKPVYNICVTNMDDTFVRYAKDYKFSSLRPNEMLEIPVEIEQSAYCSNAFEASIIPAVPNGKKDTMLNVTYENETGANIFTKLWVSLTAGHGKYAYA